MIKLPYIPGLGLTLGLAIASFSPLVLAADEPSPEAKILGMSDAILEHCAKVDPAYAANYQKRLQLVSQGASEETLAKVRKTDEYRQAYDEEAESLAKIKEQDARKGCSQALAENR